MNTKRPEFSTRFGVIAATVGSAVGLGNIWRFPYEAGVHGGAAFLLIYCLFIVIIGIPVITAEFIIGRSARANVYGAFKKLPGSKFWNSIGFIGILSALMILSFYSVVAGWTADYIIRSLQGFSGAITQAELHCQFSSFAASWQAVGCTIIFLAVNYFILRRGVQQGIEKMSNLLMPLLFVILLIFCTHSLFLPGAAQGLNFLFKPDFSQLTPSVWLGAMGQAFFSLSIGLGCLITYSGYFSDKTHLLKSATTIGVLDTLVAVLAGVIIFPAVFSYGESPAAGPKLVFEVLPSIFRSMELGMVWSTLFFTLLLVASLTSTISMAEIAIAYFSEEKGMSRNSATALTIGIAVVFGTLCSLSFGPLSDVVISNKTIFDLFDFVSSSILLPIGGILTSLFVGRVLNRQTIVRQLDGTPKAIITILIICLRYVAPICITLVFISGLGFFN
ncbi:MAG: sodium-dependent transporter [Bacteroides sp.]|nr:sodium-dependent transporter [Bacteroides sp.]MCM1379735.1 sodium-dependent transporter [Bacteroides sp.]MCM1445724.1 sodium-dependent transporter [Prevotella sp.]